MEFGGSEEHGSSYFVTTDRSLRITAWTYGHITTESRSTSCVRGSRRQRPSIEVKSPNHSPTVCDRNWSCWWLTGKPECMVRRRFASENEDDGLRECTQPLFE